jgi:Phage integrase central domain
VLGRLPVSAIDVDLVVKALQPIWEKKPETASRARGRIEAVLAWRRQGNCDRATTRPAGTTTLEHLLYRPALCRDARSMSASLIGRLGSSAFKLSTTTAASMSLAGSCFSSETAPRPFHDEDSRTRWNNLYRGLSSNERQVQADIRTHLTHRPTRRDIIPPLGGALVSSYRI